MLLIFFISVKKITPIKSPRQKKLLLVTHILLKDVAEIITSKFPGTLETLKVLKFIKIKLE